MRVHMTCRLFRRTVLGPLVPVLFPASFSITWWEVPFVTAWLEDSDHYSFALRPSFPSLFLGREAIVSLPLFSFVFGIYYCHKIIAFSSLPWGKRRCSQFNYIVCRYKDFSSKWSIYLPFICMFPLWHFLCILVFLSCTIRRVVRSTTLIGFIRAVLYNIF